MWTYLPLLVGEDDVVVGDDVLDDEELGLDEVLDDDDEYDVVSEKDDDDNDDDVEFDEEEECSKNMLNLRRKVWRHMPLWLTFLDQIHQYEWPKITRENPQSKCASICELLNEMESLLSYMKHSYK